MVELPIFKRRTESHYENFRCNSPGAIFDANSNMTKIDNRNAREKGPRPNAKNTIGVHRD